MLPRSCLITLKIVHASEIISKWIFTTIILKLFSTTNIIINQYTPQQNFKIVTKLKITHGWHLQTLMIMLGRLMKGNYNFTHTSIALEDLENKLIVILWSHNKNQIMIVKNCGVLGTPLKQGHEAKNTNLNAQWNVEKKNICGRKFQLVKSTRWHRFISISHTNYL